MDAFARLQKREENYEESEDLEVSVTWLVGLGASKTMWGTCLTKTGVEHRQNVFADSTGRMLHLDL